MQRFHCFYPLKGYTSSLGTWDQQSRQMTSLLCSDQMFQMGALTCLSSGKQVFYQAQQCQRDSRECPLSHLCSFWSVPSCYPSLSFLEMLHSRLLMTALYFSGTAQTPGSQLHDKQATEGCSFLRPVEWTLHGHTQSFWIRFGQYKNKSFNSYVTFSII